MMWNLSARRCIASSSHSSHSSSTRLADSVSCALAARAVLNANAARCAESSRVLLRYWNLSLPMITSRRPDVLEELSFKSSSSSNISSSSDASYEAGRSSNSNSNSIGSDLLPDDRSNTVESSASAHVHIDHQVELDPAARFMQDHVPASPVMKESAVPASRMARLFQYGRLAAGVGMGMVSEAAQRAIGASASTTGSNSSSSLLLSGRNIERIVERLSTMRGAALVSFASPRTLYTTKPSNYYLL
jgi:hypothetical protein